MRIRTVILTGLAMLPSEAWAQGPDRALLWVRESDEFQALARQVYHTATAAMQRHAAETAGRWAVVLDVDETALDNSVYQLERSAYGVPYDTASWNRWVRRERAVALPGVRAFIDSVRAWGGRVAFISNRTEWVREPTERNLGAAGLMQAGDRLCLAVPGDGAYTKRARRTELREGDGRCSWGGEPVTILVYVGDAMNDFPEPDEEAGVFGERFFVLPNPMYGQWEGRADGQ